jgi:rubrerythrin
MGETRENAIRILFLDVCMKIEELTAEIYHYFGNVYAEFPDASLLWKKTALEEENHRKQFELVLHLRDEVEFDINPSDLQRALRIHGKIITLLDIVKHKTPDLIGAFTLAVEMEENLADLHVQTAVRFRDESLVRLFEAFGRADQEHVEALKRLLTILLLPESEMNNLEKKEW